MSEVEDPRIQGMLDMLECVYAERDQLREELELARQQLHGQSREAQLLPVMSKVVDVARVSFELVTAERDQLRARVQELVAANDALNNACMTEATRADSLRARVRELELYASEQRNRADCEERSRRALEDDKGVTAANEVATDLYVETKRLAQRIAELERERDAWKAKYLEARKSGYEEGRAEERADGAWCCSRHAIDVIERGDHVQAAGEAEKG